MLPVTVLLAVLLWVTLIFLPGETIHTIKVCMLCAQVFNFHKVGTAQQEALMQQHSMWFCAMSTLQGGVRPARGTGLREGGTIQPCNSSGQRSVPAGLPVRLC